MVSGKERMARTNNRMVSGKERMALTKNRLAYQQNRRFSQVCGRNACLDA